jgi:hypothetical protein
MEAITSIDGHRELQTVNEIPALGYMVYVLTRNGQALVVGHGKKNRAKVIFNDLQYKTPGHIKALLLRAYHLHEPADFRRFIIACQSKEEAQRIEKELHGKIGGNKLSIPSKVEKQLFEGLTPMACMVLRIALASRFDGLGDLFRYRDREIIPPSVWNELAERLQLQVFDSSDKKKHTRKSA